MQTLYDDNENYQSQVLFYIDRPTVNKNVAYYSAVWNKKTGKLHPKQPIVVNWVMLEKDKTGQVVEKLTYLEEKYIYGISLESKTTTPERQTFCIVSMPKYPITVFFSSKEQQWKAGIRLDVPVLLDHISATVQKISFLPKVTDLTVVGFDSYGSKLSQVISVNKSLSIV